MKADEPNDDSDGDNAVAGSETVLEAVVVVIVDIVVTVSVAVGRAVLCCGG